MAAILVAGLIAYQILAPVISNYFDQTRYVATYDSLEFELEQSPKKTTLTVTANPSGATNDTAKLTVDWGGQAKRTYEVIANGKPNELVAPAHIPNDEPITVRVTNSDTGEELFSGTVTGAK